MPAQAGTFPTEALPPQRAPSNEVPAFADDNLRL
jgi:hypothetical protein